MRGMLEHDWRDMASKLETPGLHFRCQLCRKEVYAGDFLSLMDFQAAINRKNCNGSPGPKPADDFTKVYHGLLSPEGELYQCNYFGHLALAAKINGTWSVPDESLMQRGWGRLSTAWNGDEWSFYKYPTQKQLDIIWDWCVVHPEYDYDKIIKRIEEQLK